MDTWNSSSDPEFDDDYIVTIEGAKTATSLYWDGESWRDEEGHYYKVIAWQPFPKIYVKGKG